MFATYSFELDGYLWYAYHGKTNSGIKDTAVATGPLFLINMV